MKTFLIAVIAAGASVAQNRPANQPEGQIYNLPAYQVGANDLLAVSVYAAPELSKVARVTGDGYIRLPMLKLPIKVEGLMPSDIENAVAEAIEKDKLLVSPVVTVTIAEYSSRPINVAGAVRAPQTFQAVGPLRLLDALSKAGGLAETAGPEILVSAGGREARRIPVRGLLETADPALNLPLSGGEEIRVLEAGRAFVVGNVKRPGAFVLRDSNESTLLKILALAEGLAPFPAKQAYIYRRGAEGKRQEITVELEQILKRKHEDVTLAPDDILYIPENKGRRLGVAALEKAVMFGSSASAALIYTTR